MTKGGFDSEYASLMAELGEGGKGPGDGPKNPWTGSAGHDITAGGSNIPPWRRPEVWQSSAVTPQNNGYRPPQAGFPGYGGGYGGAPAAPGQQWAGQAGYGGAQGGASYYPSQDYSANYAQYYQGQYAQQQTGTPSH